MLFSANDRKLAELISSKQYHFVGEKCKRCCKTCKRYSGKSKSNPKNICSIATAKEISDKNFYTGFGDADCIDMITYPGYVCKNWKSKE